MNNRIPRDATRLAVTFKINTSSHVAGQTVTIEKNDRGEWHGGGYFFFVSMLRNADVCSIRVI